MLDNIDDAIEVSDEEAKEITEAARHEQVLESFDKLTKAVIKSNNNDQVDSLIKSQTKAIAGIVETIKENQPKIDFDQSEIISLLKEVIVSNNNVISVLENRLLPHAFILVKGYGQITESVNVLYKPANQINDLNFKK